MVRSSNPVLTRLTPETQTGYRGGVGYAPEPSYPSAVLTGTETDRMTIDDVVTRTVGLLALTGASAAVAWMLVPTSALSATLITTAMIGLVLGLVIAFARVTNPAVIGAYAVVEGIFVGLVSKLYESFYSGIVIQAVVATFGLFFLMAALFKSRVIRATPKFVKWVMGALIGVFSLIMISFVLSFFGVNTHLRDGGPLAIVFSLVVIAVASLTFILDFAQIEEGVAAGMPRKYAWACAFGILVGLIWLYLEILRLLSYLQGKE